MVTVGLCVPPHTSSSHTTFQDPYNQLPMPPPRTLPPSIQDTCKPIPRLILRTAHLQLPLNKQVGGNFSPEMGGKIQAAIEIGADTAWL